ncbi:MAG: hypothetical protein GWP14_04605 [Actinobacteria bacterium]|nr:hypothetical protein [Actinomycetota bacterium]
MPYACITTISPPAHYSLYVDGNRTDAYTEQGNILFPYKSLQAALTQAQTLLNVLGTGFEDNVVSVNVIVAAGHYNEDVTFTFPTPSRRISIVGKGSFTETRIKSLTITPCLDAADTLPNIITLGNLEIGSFDQVATAPALKFVGVSGGRLTDLNIYNCRIISKASDVPVLEIGDPSGDCQVVFARLGLGCEVRRRFSSTTSVGGVAIYKGDLHLDGATIRCDTGPCVQISNDVNLRAYNSAFDSGGAADANTLECSGTSVAQLYNCLFETLGTGHSIIHTGTYPGSGLASAVGANMCLFLRETGDAINAAAGALVIVGPNFDAVNLETGPQITVADPALLKRLQAASMTAYSPTTAGDWVSVPAEVKEALDELAARVKTLEP